MKVAKMGQADQVCGYIDNGGDNGNLIIEQVQGGIERRRKDMAGVVRFTPLANIADIEYTVK
jgi:hypothetical protein